jgi:DNA-binding Xre family transcriptional regulator
MSIAKYFWDLNEHALRETKRALEDPRHPQFAQRMVTLLSRCEKPKELFQILSKDKFLEAWPAVRTYWLRRERQSEQRNWWETLYERLLEKTQRGRPIKGQPGMLFRKFGMNIKEKRLAKGLSQKQVALQTGLTQPIISDIEEGKKNITLFTLLRLCKVLDIKTLDVSN